MPFVVTSIARISDWKALERQYRDAFLVHARDAGAMRHGVYRNARDASQVLLVAELPDPDAADEIIRAVVATLGGIVLGGHSDDRVWEPVQFQHAPELPTGGIEMSTAESRQVMEAFLIAINTGDSEALGKLLATDFTWHSGSFGGVRGAEPFMQVVGPFFAAFPGLHVTVEKTVAEHDRVAVRMFWEGTHQGSFMGVPATGRRVRVSGNSIYRVEGGQVAEEWWLEDIFGLMQQIGAVPSAADAPA